MLIPIIATAFTGVSIGILCYLLMERKQKQITREDVRARFGAAQASPLQKRQDSLEKLPFIGPAMQKRQKLRIQLRCEAELPRMLDVLAMGMQSGLSFDAAFSLYVNRFNTDLALLCRKSFDLWERGLISREEGLKQISAGIEISLFDHFRQTAIRSIRHGVPMAPLMKEYAKQARKEHRNKQKEQVLKAPVKMLLPTGCLILPAMMMLIIGPIILDVTERMV